VIDAPPESLAITAPLSSSSVRVGVKASLDYNTREFGPYQFHQLRILEFPRYAEFAQSFPNTVPYSEGIGFITRVGTGDDDIDMPFFVTAHEVAHQWWGHQVGWRSYHDAWLSEGFAEFTSGLVLFARSHAARVALSQRWGEVEKRYGQPVIGIPLAAPFKGVTV